ncbi:MAG: hypothetical protein IT245_02190 [Bacteroidia bacterium]|nr:hypothetical protein [Bacteroidia bacterium]
MPVIAAFISIFLYIKTKKYYQLGFYLIALISVWFIIIIFFNRGDGNIFMEKNFTPWILIAFYPLKDLLEIKNYKLNMTPFIGLSFILLFSLYGIFKVTPMYQKRLYLMDRLITSKNPGKSKIIIQDSVVNHDEWLGIWALPYETLLLSKVKGLQPITAKIYHNEDYINKELHRDDIFLGADFIPVLPSSFLLNKKIFALKTEKYWEITNP